MDGEAVWNSNRIINKIDDMRFVAFVTLIVSLSGTIYAHCSSSRPQGCDPGTFSNPVIFADVPDVDVIRVGKDYYMVSTTAHMSPGAPVMHSTDLVNWEIISYVFDTIDESPANNLDGGSIYGRGQWAPSIRYNDGIFYVFFGTGNKSYLYTSTDPYGKWEKKLELDEYLHDASLLFDTDGRIYIAYGVGNIRIVELKKDLSGIDKEGTDVQVINSNPPGLLEGTHFYKFNGMYYLTLIWWPAGGIRTQVCFRSEHVYGPYDDMRVILQDDLGYPGHGVAQGCLIDTDEDDNWYAILFQDHEAVGRVPVLMPCRWEYGWPVLGDENGKVPHVMEYPLHDSGKRTALASSDDFDSATLGLRWQWNHNPDNSKWSLTERPGYLRLRTGKTVNSIFDARNTLTQRTEGPACSGIVSMDLSNMLDGDRAGLAVFCSEPGTVSVVKEHGKKYIIMTDRENEVSRIEFKGDRIYLRIDCIFGEDNATFHYSEDDRNWVQIGGEFHMVFNVVHFTGNKFAIFYYAEENPGGYVDVDFFRYSRQEQII